jgi:hypothetical protein
MTEDGAMEQIGSTECCALRFCLHIGLLGGATLGGATLLSLFRRSSTPTLHV